jgi:hypothetical protein
MLNKERASQAALELLRRHLLVFLTMNRLFIALPVDKKIISHVFENLSEKNHLIILEGKKRKYTYYLKIFRRYRR